MKINHKIIITFFLCGFVSLAYCDDDISGFSYITVRNKSKGVASASGGFGLAWRPSSKNVLETATVSSYDSGTGTLTFTTGEIFGNLSGLGYINNIPFNYTPLQSPGNSIVVEKLPIGVGNPVGAVLTSMEHNLYIVDNDVSSSDIYDGHFFEGKTGALSFISSGVAIISPNVEYNFRILINEDNSMSCFIKSTLELNFPAEPNITSPARTPISEYLGTSDVDSFAISVNNTIGHKWYYDDISIGYTAARYPSIFFKMDVAKLPEQMNVIFNASGQGYDSASTAKTGVKLYARNKQSQWDLIGENGQSRTYQNSVTSVINKSDYTSEDFIDFALIGTFPSGGATNKHSYIKVDFFELVGASDIAMSIGGAVDVYIDDDYLTEGTALLEPTTAGQIMEFPSTDRAVVWIDKVTLQNSPDNELIEGVHYMWAWNDEDFKYSSKVTNSLILTGSDAVLVNYRYSPLVKSAQETLSEDKMVAYKGQDIIVKHMDIYMINVESDIEPNSEELMLTSLAKYVKDLQLNGDDVYVLRWDEILGYLVMSGVYGITKLYITINHRESGLLKSKILRKPGDTIMIDKYSTFRVEGYLYAR